jgi:hypothetical protein
MYHIHGVLPVVLLQVALADHVRGNRGSGCLQADVAKHADLSITNNPCPHVNAELLLLSRTDYTVRILLCPLVLVVNVNDAVSTETCTDETEKCSALLRTKHRQKFCSCSTLQVELLLHLSPDICIPINMEDILSTYCEYILSAITHKLNVSRHMLIWSFFPVLVRGTHAQILSAPFSYILYEDFC